MKKMNNKNQTDVLLHSNSDEHMKEKPKNVKEMNNNKNQTDMLLHSNSDEHMKERHKNMSQLKQL